MARPFQEAGENGGQLWAIDPMMIDVLKEIGNVGTGNAATALATMLNAKVDIGLPQCEMVPFSQITRGFSDPEELVVGVLVQLSGDMDGFIMMVLTEDAAFELLTLITGQGRGMRPERLFHPMYRFKTYRGSRQYPHRRIPVRDLQHDGNAHHPVGSRPERGYGDGDDECAGSGLRSDGRIGSAYGNGIS